MPWFLEEAEEENGEGELEKDRGDEVEVGGDEDLVGEDFELGEGHIFRLQGDAHYEGAFGSECELVEGVSEVVGCRVDAGLPLMRSSGYRPIPSSSP